LGSPAIIAAAATPRLRWLLLLRLLLLLLLCFPRFLVDAVAADWVLVEPFSGRRRWLGGRSAWKA
jgi:hypothetical protein